MKELEKAAEILVECGYAEKNTSGVANEQNFYEVFKHYMYYTVEPFLDTLEGRRQADAIEDYLRNPNNTDASHAWNQSGCVYFEHDDKYHQWRLDRIKWCLQELIK